MCVRPLASTICVGRLLLNEGGGQYGREGGGCMYVWAWPAGGGGAVRERDMSCLDKPSV